MSDGRTHGLVTGVLSLPCGVLATAATGSLLCGAAGTAGCLFGLICDPDLDQPGITRAEGRILSSPLWMLGVAWFVIWYPYGRLIPHRHMISHWPIVGTGGRILYLGVVGLLVYWLILSAWPIAGDWLAAQSGRIPSSFISWFVFSLAVSDTAHWLFDGRP